MSVHRRYDPPDVAPSVPPEQQAWLVGVRIRVDTVAQQSPPDVITGSALPRTEKVSELVARRILHDIVERSLTPGTKLPPESEMLATYRVSRGSLREALRILETLGFIRIKAGSGGGPIVAPARSEDFARTATMYFHMSGATLGELFQTRLSLETEMAAFAARAQQPQLLEALRTNLEAASRLDASENDATHSTAARDFHDIITGMSGNRILDLLCRGIRDIYVARVRHIEYPADTRHEIHAMHEKIASAIMDGDSVLASTLMRAHMEEYLERSVLANVPGVLDEVIDWR